MEDINEEVLLEGQSQEWNMLDFFAGLYGQLKGFNIPYDATRNDPSAVTVVVPASVENWFAGPEVDSELLPG